VHVYRGLICGGVLSLVDSTRRLASSKKFLPLLLPSVVCFFSLAPGVSTHSLKICERTVGLSSELPFTHLTNSGYNIFFSSSLRCSLYFLDEARPRTPRPFLSLPLYSPLSLPPLLNMVFPYDFSASSSRPRGPPHAFPLDLSSI